MLFFTFWKLGGAADVCEVRVKDEITEINRRKVSTYSHTQVQDLIKRAVRTGKLELKVKRYLRKGKQDVPCCIIGCCEDLLLHNNNLCSSQVAGDRINSDTHSIRFALRSHNTGITGRHGHLELWDTHVLA